MIQICRTRDVLMIESRNINIIVDADGNRLVLINDIVFKGKSRRNQKRNEQATTISVVKTHFLPKIVARSSFVVKNYEKIIVDRGY